VDPLSQHLAQLEAASPLPFALNSRACLRLDLTGDNPRLRGIDPGDAAQFSAWIAACLADAGAAYAAGGYAEDRAIYTLSPLFKTAEKTRTLHLGIDLWLAEGTAVHAVLGGVVHSTRDNAVFGDYGPTIVLEHAGPGRELGERFYTLYGHLSRASLQATRPGQAVTTGARIGWLGGPEENLGWPPHLHFQVIRDMGGRQGDYPGVCHASERDPWLAGSPDPNLLLRIAALSTAPIPGG